MPPCLLSAYPTDEPDRPSQQDTRDAQRRPSGTLVSEIDGIWWHDLMGSEIEQARRKIEALTTSDAGQDSDSDW